MMMFFVVYVVLILKIIIFFEAQNAVKKNIGGKDGWLWREWINQDTNGQSQYGYMFSYLDGENMVIISASEEYLIEEVIV